MENANIGKFAEILSEFPIEGIPLSCEPYGEGHINETYLVITERGDKTRKYILQRINTNLFTDVDKLMSNIVGVTEFNRRRVTERGEDPDRRCLTVIPTISGSPYLAHASGCYRMYIFIDGAIAHQFVSRPKQFYQSAVGFGEFANMLADFDATTLYEILPSFHDTKKRYSDFLAALSDDKAGRAAQTKRETEFATKMSHLCDSLTSLLRSGEMPTRVTHNDTKLNNVLLDAVTDDAVAVIDLDTVMPGSVCYDFGDSIRFGCNTAAEDEQDTGKVQFNLDLFGTYARGFLSSLNSITQVERENLAMGAVVMTYECGLRFLSDYLNGDVYFRTAHEKHNLYRCRTQFKLVSEMLKHYDKMQKIIEDIGNNR